MSRRLVLVLVGLAVAGAAAAAIPARASYGERVTADEPQYLLSATSLAEDLDLDIRDELVAERWRDYNTAELPRQTEPRADGREVSPHDPLLPLLLAGPVAVGGWQAAKAALALLAGLLAALLVWTATERFGVGLPVAAGTVLAFGLAAPLTTYGTQVYPELPAALALTAAVAALTGPFGRRSRLGFGLAVVAMPWLAVKYTPVAAALVLVGLATARRRPGGGRAAMQAEPNGEADHQVRRSSRRSRTAFVRVGRTRPRSPFVLVAALAAAAAVFLAFHRVVYGGWTAYAAGDNFTGGELTAVGTSPNYLGRSTRLLGLLVDRGFGLAAWAPIFLLAVPAITAVVRRRPPGWAALVLPLLAGWLNATFVALTMHGYWWPGRQVVVVLPAAVLATAWWLDRHRTALPAAAGAAVAGLVLWWWLLLEVLGRTRTLIVDFEGTRDPLARAWRSVLPDYRNPTTRTWVLQVVWIVVVAALARWGWRSAPPPNRSGGDEDASAGERADAHVAAVDLDRGGAVR